MDLAIALATCDRGTVVGKDVIASAVARRSSADLLSLLASRSR